jgi:hypothetical protein
MSDNYSNNEQNNKYLTAYNIANDQVRLYAEFRWKAFYYLAALNAGAFILYLNSEFKSIKIILSLVSLLMMIFILAFERRHRLLFNQSREIGKNLEIAMFGEQKLQFGVFSYQIQNKRGSHERLLISTVVILVSFWIAIISVTVFNIKFD